MSEPQPPGSEPLPPGSEPLPPGSMPRVPATREQAAALASAVRLRILRMTYYQPMTNREIARRLDRDPATTLHHVRKLVDASLLEVLPVRRGTRGAREIPYRATGLSWSLDVGPYDRVVALNEAMLEAYLGEVAEIGIEHLEQTRLVLRLDEPQLTEFRDRLYELLQEFAARPVAPADRGQAVYVALHPLSPTSLSPTSPRPGLQSAPPSGKPGARRVTMEEV